MANSREISAYLARLIRDLPRCSFCESTLIATCDKSKPSQLTEFKGGEWTKTKPQFMRLFPTTKEQSKICPYCEDKLHPTKAGKES